ncbi:MAG: ATP-binding protein [Deltaproteobacteria bacterium]|jgi:uncharacterized protein|nr:ATP-binding protein [Deltaproteobacteria bacterium]
MKKRPYYVKIWNELSADKSMIFLSGPRQAGKTTLAEMIALDYTNTLYFNWDISAHRVRFINDSDFFKQLERKDSSLPLIIFDEIHKYKEWKNYLKGVSDDCRNQYQFLISGSGRLDTFQKGSDSMAGRYYQFHLCPFTFAELEGNKISFDDFIDNPLALSNQSSSNSENTWKNLEQCSGFPEPFLKGKKATYRRWSNTYSKQLIHEDIRDFTALKSIVDIETLYMILPGKIGNPLSISSLAGDLKVSYNSVHSWLTTFETFYLTFTITPWINKISRAIQKERKLYIWDTPRIENPGARFENMIALELHRAVTLWNDIGYGNFKLHYIKNKERQEVDFLIVNHQKPFLLIEAKYSNTKPSPALIKFQSMLNIPAVQLTSSGEHYQLIPNGAHTILISSAYRWLANLP